VKLAWYADARQAGRVPPSVFWPVPNVDSGLVAFTRRQPPDADRRAVFAVVDAAFAQRRKTLANALTAGLGQPADVLRAAAESAGIDPSRRAETLTIVEFAELTRRLS